MKGIVLLFFVAFAAVAHAQKTMLVEECPKDQADDWTIELLIRHEDCNKFYKCTFGKPVEYVCPADLWFNLETQRCDWRHNVDCTDRYVPGETTTTSTTTAAPITSSTTPETTTTTTPEPTTTTTPEPTTTTTTTTEPTTTTTTTPEPTTTTTTTTEPTTTTTTTTEPTTTTTTTTTTPEPTTTTTTTTPPTQAPPTSTTPTIPPTAPTTTTSTAAPITFLPNGCPTNPHIHWLLPHETNCNWFYYCVWGQLVLRECPSTLHFNRVIQVCDWPWDAKCPQTLNKHLDSRASMRR